MSIGKVLGGTVIATPAVGGGGYVIYKEVTKEGETSLPEKPAEVTGGTTAATGPTVPGAVPNNVGAEQQRTNGAAAGKSSAGSGPSGSGS